MPICKKCGKSFSIRLNINGNKKILKRRTNCFECSPYDKPNKETFDQNGIECTCIICGRIYFYNRTSGHSTKKCNSCLVNSSKEIKKKMSLFYKGGKCVICDYDKCPEALDCHHFEKTEKDFTISGSHCLSWEKIKEEIDKCILVCCRCHREIHLNLFSDEYLKELYKNQKQIDGINIKFIELEEIYNENIKKYKKKNVEIKCECGNIFIQKSKRQKYCSYECSTKYRRKVIWPTKEELSELLKNSTLVSISKKYGVSDNAVKKWAKSYNLL